MLVNGTFRIEQLDDTMVLTPLANLGEFDYERIEQDGRVVLDQLAQAQAKNVVIDLSQIDYYGSTALGFFTKLWKRSQMQGGRMALCQVSPQERKILEVTRLDSLWSIYDSREQALRAVQGNKGHADNDD